MMKDSFTPDGANGPRVMAIASGKGGVGKTFFSVHIASHAARRGMRVLLMDADLGLANVDVMLGITPAGNIQQVLDGDASLHHILATGIRGFDVLPGGSGLHRLTRLSASQQTHLLDEINAVAAGYDLVLVDTPAGIGENVLFFTSCAESVVTILTPDPTSLTDAYALIKVLSRQRSVDRFMVAVNQASETEANLTFQRLLSVADRYLDVVLDFAGFMPVCPEVRRAIQSQRLLYEYADLSHADTLDRLINSILSRPRPTSGGGLRLFWQRSLSDGLACRAGQGG